MSPVLDDRVSQVLTRPLLEGGHDNFAAGFCVMEAVAYVAGEPWSDHPACACPVIGAFMRSWNDAIKDDAHRTQLLQPYIVKLVGSRSTREVEQRRADLCLDWLARQHTATWLDRVESLKPHAEKIRALPPLFSIEAIE